MSRFSLLPARWRRSDETARHAEAIRGILDTPPLVPGTGGLALFAEIGAAQVLPALVAIKSLHRQLGRGRVVLLDDGTLTGEDRALLAHHLADPEMLAQPPRGKSPLGEGPGWQALASVLERRGSEYWIWLASQGVTLGPVPEIAQAVALNASFMLPGEGPSDEAQGLARFCRAAFPGGPANQGPAMTRIESRLDRVARPDWRYARGSAGLAGFAAGGPGLRFAGSVWHTLATLVGAETLAEPGAVQVAANLQLASEKRTVMLPRSTYLYAASEAVPSGTAFACFTAPPTTGHDEASRFAIGQLRTG